MNKTTAIKTVTFILAALSLGAATGVYSQQAAQKTSLDMSFFTTSKGLGKGADLGGLAGADAHCQTLAASVGAGKRTWRAYLSATGGGQSAANTRDRIGKGPWYGTEGRLIARDVDELHNINNINRLVAVDENGKIVRGRGDTPNTHDMLTGPMPDGTAYTAKEDATCGNWAKSGPGAALLGHHHRSGLRQDEPSRSWNLSHRSRACDQASLVATGSGELFYCFAAN